MSEVDLQDSLHLPRSSSSFSPNLSSSPGRPRVIFRSEFRSRASFHVVYGRAATCSLVARILTVVVRRSTLVTRFCREVLRPHNIPESSSNCAWVGRSPPFQPIAIHFRRSRDDVSWYCMFELRDTPSVAFPCLFTMCVSGAVCV